DLFAKLDFEKVVDGTKWFFDNTNDDLFLSFLNHLKSKYLGSNVIDDENEKIDYFINAFKNTGRLSSIKREFSNKLNGKPEGVSTIKSLKEYDIASQVISILDRKSTRLN